MSPNSLINVLLALRILKSILFHIGLKYVQVIKMKKGEMGKMAEVINSDNLCSKHLGLSCQRVAERLVCVFGKWSKTLHSSCVYLDEEEGG